MPAAFEVKKSKNNQFFFHLLAANGDIILSSEMYSSRTGEKGIASVQANAANPDRYDRRKDKRGQAYFVLKAANHRVIGCGESYSAPAKMEKGIKSVIKNGTTTKVRDGTM